MNRNIAWSFECAQTARAIARVVARGGSMALALLALLVCGQSALAATGSAVSKEYQLKAAFLYNFTKFVEWPPQPARDPDQPIVIGVAGRNPFGDELEKIVEGRKVNGRSITVRRITAASEARAVDLLFIGVDEDRWYADMLAAIEGAPVVTVGESARSAALGAMITFTMEAERVRFEINQEAAEKAGLKISAQLLKLATVVRKRPAGG
jgi:hypothetical protein